MTKGYAYNKCLMHTQTHLIYLCEKMSECHFYPQLKLIAWENEIIWWYIFCWSVCLFVLDHWTVFHYIIICTLFTSVYSDNFNWMSCIKTNDIIFSMPMPLCVCLSCFPFAMDTFRNWYLIHLVCKYSTIYCIHAIHILILVFFFRFCIESFPPYFKQYSFLSSFQDFPHIVFSSSSPSVSLFHLLTSVFLHTVCQLNISVYTYIVHSHTLQLDWNARTNRQLRKIDCGCKMSDS